MALRIKQAIYSAETITQVEYIRAVLNQEGIRTTVRNQYLGSGLGELPAFECWPELWLENEQDTERARHIIQTCLNQETNSTQDWVCPQCHECIEGQFGQCWNCGAENPN